MPTSSSSSSAPDKTPLPAALAPRRKVPDMLTTESASSDLDNDGINRAASADDDEDDFKPLVGAKALPARAKVTALELEPSHSHHHGVPPPGTANTVQMIINIIISFVGAGLLGQPHAFMKSGWLLGGFCLLGVSAINVYAMLLMCAVQAALLKRYTHREVASYADIGRVILGPRGERVVILCLGISQAGFATAYIIFIAANLYSIAQWSRFWVCLACIPGLVGLVQFQDLSSLSYFSLLANVANFCALSAVLFQDYKHYEPHNDTIHAIQWSGMLYVVAITIYSMEGVGLILSLQASYKEPQKFAWLLSVTLGVISLFMVLFGAAGYWAFGLDTQAPITLNLVVSASSQQPSSWFGAATFVKLALCLGLYLTYPIMMFPIWNIWETWQPQLQTDSQRRYLMRASVVVASATVAFLVPNFGKFLSLVGSSICTLLGFIFPPWFHLAVLGKELPMWQYILDIVVLMGGCIFAILGTYQSVVAMASGDDVE